MSYGLADAEATDAQKAAALEAQASDMEKIASTLEAFQPAAALALKNQVNGMRQQAASFRDAAGLPSAESWSLYSKTGLALASMVGLAAGYAIGRKRIN